MKIPIDKQIAFLDWQVKENEDLFRSYLSKSMTSHFADRTAFIGKVWGIDRSRGNLVIRFQEGRAPRLNMPFSGFLFSGVPTPNNLSAWDFSYESFRREYAKARTDILPIYFLQKDESTYNFVGCKDVETEFVNWCQKTLDQGRHPTIVLAERDPPVQYLLNLKAFIQQYPKDQILNLSLEKSLTSWVPAPFQDSQDNVKEVIASLEERKEIIIQGPPGTGKSYLIAQVVEQFLGQKRSVCITALTNKALMEVAEKPGIATLARQGKVFKTNLTLGEATANPALKQASNLGVEPGSLLLATYYKLSEWYSSNNHSSKNSDDHIYDLVIIEEASQCFLATIAAFQRLGKKVLIVGDPLQLPPIVLNAKNANVIHPEIMRFANGLASYAANADNKAYLLNQSYRLTAAAATLTSLFYHGRLQSARKNFMGIKAGDEFGAYIPKEGGTRIKFMPIISEGDRPPAALRFTVDFLVEIKACNPGLEVAILAPFKNTVRALQELIGPRFPDQSDLTIETIDRIQGLTVDFTIFLVPLNNPSFALNLNRFNVATSRAKRGTLIITDNEYGRFMGIDPRVTEYLDRLE